MPTSSHQLWPFGPRAAVLAVPAVFVGLLLLTAILRATAGWPGAESDSIVLTGVFVLSLLPVVLFLVDLLVERGAVVEYKGVKLDFSRVTTAAAGASTSVPTNIGVPGKALTDSDSSQILETLDSAVAHDVVVIDLQDGDAWWETRLLVLAAGAVRRGRPSAIVFIAQDGGVAGRFQGWGEPASLLQRLLRGNPAFPRIYHIVEAAAEQWASVAPNPIGLPPGKPATPASIDGLAAAYFWMAFDDADGLPNPLRFEQLLTSELGKYAEMPVKPHGISLGRLEELFRPILHKSAIDETGPNQQQLETFFAGDAPFIAITRNGRYERLLSRAAAQIAILKSLAMPAKRDE